jgi:hypothetical protein
MKPARPQAPTAADYGTDLASLLELEQRHDELLGRLEELDAQVEKVLAEWTASRGATGDGVTASGATAAGL